MIPDVYLRLTGMGQPRSYKEIPMKLIKLLSSTAVAAVFVFAATPSAHAGGGGFVGAMESTQWLNNAELVNIYSSNLEQLQQQIQMYQNMYQNTLGIPIQRGAALRRV